MGGSWNATASSAVISANGLNAGAPVVTGLSAASDKAGSVVQYYKVNSMTVATNVNTTTSLPVNTTNGFLSGDVIVIRHAATDSYEKRILTTYTTVGTMNVTVAPTTALAAGDTIYDVSVAGAIPWGPLTNTITGAGICSGQPGMPLLLDITGTSSCAIWSACAEYK
ncbi:MAG TPA: hypothetical protein VHA37_04515 [Candidatus Saccharimonadales bacterium]|nr:hypothetical protein [Candidatus Saccharimonadales bacterium]